MKKNTNEPDVSAVINEPETNTMLIGDHFIPRCNRTMRDSVDYVLYRTSANKESAAEIRKVLNSYLRNIKTNNFFLMENIKNVIDDVQANPSMFYFFKTLDHVFMITLQSLLEAEYKVIVKQFVVMLKNILPESRTLSVLNDINYMNSTIDFENIEKVLANNSIIFTLYFFSMAFPFTASFHIS